VLTAPCTFDQTPQKVATSGWLTIELCPPPTPKIRSRKF
jgi:hypothetical protein